MPKSCQGSVKISLVMLALSPATYVKSLSRSASVSSTSERPRKSSLNFSCSSEHFVLHFSINAGMSCRTCSKYHRRNDPYRLWRTQKFQFLSHVRSQSQESRLMLPPPQRNLTLIGLAVTLGSFGNPFCFVLTRHSIIAKMC